MIKKSKPRFFVICLISLLFVPLFGQDGGGGSVLEPKLITPIRAVVPMALQNKRIENPRVVAMIQVSGAGRVEDLVVLEASHVGLVERAESLIRKALFDPGDLALNESVRFELILPFQYPADLGGTGTNIADDIEGAIATVKVEDHSLALYSMKELDAPISIIDRGDVYKPTDAEGNTVPGEATVEVYVNHEGEVRLPRVVSSTHDEVALAAIATFGDMLFTKPLHDGRPAVTRVRLPFSAE